MNICLLSLCAGAVFSNISVSDVIGNYIEIPGSETKLVRVLFRCYGLIASILFVEYIKSVNKVRPFLKSLFTCLLLYVFIVDVEALLFVSRVEIVKDDANVEYLGGNKFTLTYSNMYLAIIYYKYKTIINQFNKRHFYCILVLCLIMSIYTKCSTSIIASSFFLFFFLLRWYNFSILYKSYFYLLASTICTLAFPVFSTTVLDWGVVRSTLNFLGESDDLTGRLVIYTNLSHIIEERPVWGYGLGNAGAIVNNVSNSFNAQNGVLDLYIQLGVYGVIFYFLILLYFLKMTKNQKSSYSLLCFLYMILIISMVEIPLSFTTLFIASLAIITPNIVNPTYEKTAVYRR